MISIPNIPYSYVKPNSGIKNRAYVSREDSSLPKGTNLCLKYLVANPHFYKNALFLSLIKKALTIPILSLQVVKYPEPQPHTYDVRKEVGRS